MNYEELMEYLEIDGPEDFQYFEAMADLIESDDEIDQEAIYQLMADVDKEIASQLLHEYFDDVTGGLPEDSDDIFSLLEQIRMCLTGLMSNSFDESDMRVFVDELVRFRKWYCYESKVELLSEEGGNPLLQSVRDAITTARIEKLGGEEYRYSFIHALDYPIDSYTMSIAELAATEGGEENDEY